MFRRGVAVIAAVLIVTAGCSSDGDPAPKSSDPRPTITPASTPPTPSPTPTESAAVTAAKNVYLQFTRLSDEAERAPKKADFDKLETVAIDQALGDIEKEILAFQANDFAFRGVAPERRITVRVDKSTVPPRPTVELRDCPTASLSWKPYNLRTGDPAPTVAAKVPPPYATTVSVVQLKGRWVVAAAKTDRSKTCVA